MKTDSVSRYNNEHYWSVGCGLVYGMIVIKKILLPHTYIGIQSTQLVMDIYRIWSNYGHQRSDLNTFRFRIEHLLKSEGDSEEYRM